MERQACADLEAGRFETLAAAVGSPSWGVARAALLACEFRTEDEGGVPVSPRAIDGALAILGRTQGATQPDAVLARIRALLAIRDNVFPPPLIQIDPPLPLGLRYTPGGVRQALLRARSAPPPRRPSTAPSYAR